MSDAVAGYRDVAIHARSLTSVLEPMDVVAPELLTELTEVLERDRPMTWSNLRQEGTVANWHQVRSMVDRIGTSIAWTFLVVSIHTPEGDWFAQSCGDAIDGLVVEIDTDDSTVMVVPRGAPGRHLGW
jgi:hypothetical protein